MQSLEFNKLMLGSQAMWADLSKTDDGLLQLLKDPNADKLLVRKQIEEKEVEIPVEMRTKIDAFIADCKKRGVKERTIRRQVQRKFNIVVV